MQKTEAIVLNKIKYSDSSFIVNLISEDLGRFAAMVRISKSSKSNIKQASFFPLNIIETEINLKNNREVQTLTYCNNVENLQNILLDINKLTIAQFIAEIILKTIKEKETNSKTYNYIKNFTLELNSNSSETNNIHLLFLKDFAALSGFEMYNNYCKETPFFNIKEGLFSPVFTSSTESLDLHESQILCNLLSAKNTKELIKLNPHNKRLLIEKILLFYEHHIPNFGKTKSLKILQEVFND